MSVTVSNPPLKNWIPYKLIFENNLPLVCWCYVSDIRFEHPFFEETIARCKSHPYNSSGYRSISTLETMIDWAETFTDTAPISFIFHISRCGSTLLSQLIGLNKKHTVLAEVPFFDELLRLPYKLKNRDEQFQKKILRAAIKLVGQNRFGNEEHLFIKTDSWHICFYQIYRELYPTSPAIFLYRSPDEVVSSHQKHRGMQAIPNLIEPELFGFNENDVKELSLDAYTAKVLEKYLLLFEEIISTDSLAMQIDYKQGATDMIHLIGKHLNINWEEEHLKQINTRSLFHSKHPEQNFLKEIKSNIIPDYLQDAMNVYERLNLQIVAG